MTDRSIGKPTRAPHLRLLVNDEFVDPVEQAASAFADRLIAEYEKLVADRPLAFSNTVTVLDYPEEAVVERAIVILSERGFDADPEEHTCAGGRAGSVRMSARDPHRQSR